MYYKNDVDIDSVIDGYFRTAHISYYKGSYEGLATAISLVTGTDIHPYMLRRYMQVNKDKLNHIDFEFTT